MKEPKVQRYELLLANEWLRSAIAIVIAVLLWRLSDAAIAKFYARRFVSRFIPRVPTYSSLTKSLAGAAIFFFLVLELLNIWKVNVAPALWSAGALGVVIGIGAQAIVRDVLTGAFHLFEDTFDVGDGVELTTTNGIVRGVVESVGLRQTQLVDDRGYVVFIPYGSIVYVANTTRQPLRVTMQFNVPLSEDVARLRERIVLIAQDAVKKADVAADNLHVQLADVTSANAVFNVSFETSRVHARTAESSLRELIATRLQSEGLLPGAGDGRAGSPRTDTSVGRINSTAPSTGS